MAHPPLPILLLLLTTFSHLNHLANSHQDSGTWTCDSDSDIRLAAGFNPGLVTIDGHPDDWKSVDGFDFSLRPALDPDADKEYKAGKMTFKALHDGSDVFFFLEVDGDYAYTNGVNTKCPSVSLMFQIGDDATYHNMGGCKEGKGTCTNKTCKGHEVDIMHFSLGNAIPGRLYGGNPIDNANGTGGDRFGHLVDLYAWNPHCRFLDGIGPSGNDSSAQNNWKGSWWHSSLDVHSGFIQEDSPYGSGGEKGKYYFEFSRPLRTMDRLQQDAQFTISGSSKMAIAFWYPLEGNPWHGSGHYSINCEWIPLDILSGSSKLAMSSPKGGGGGSGEVASAFALLFSVISICLSVFVAYNVAKPRSRIPFIPMENL